MTPTAQLASPPRSAGTVRSAPSPRSSSGTATRAAPPCVLDGFLSPMGPMHVAASVQGLCGVWFEGQRHMPELQTWPRLNPDDPDHARANAHLTAVKKQLSEYFSGRRAAFDLTLDCRRGTAFQQSVWRALLCIESGATETYGGLAQRLGQAKAVRAIGAAVGRNPISIVVPCHRVWGANGALTGYAGGLDRKAALLKLEGVL